MIPLKYVRFNENHMITFKSNRIHENQAKSMKIRKITLRTYGINANPLAFMKNKYKDALRIRANRYESRKIVPNL